jgi:tetratricopeptide (TPR) repeat protein
MRRLLFIASVLALCASNRADAATAQSAAQLCESESGDARILACNEAIRLNPQDAAAYKRRGIAWARKGNHDQAIADFSQAIRLIPQDAIAYYNRGTAWGRKGNTDKAIADYNEAIRLNPQVAAAYENRGFAWAAKGNLERAIADFTSAIRLDPQNGTAYDSRGVALLNKGDFDGAVADLSASIRLNPLDALAFRNRGVAWAGRSDHDKAIADFSQAIRLTPQDADAYYNRGFMWGRKGYYDKAIGDYNEAIRLNPQDALAYSNRGFAWYSKGTLDRAIADYKDALRLDPSNSNVSENLQLALAKAERLKPSQATAIPSVAPELSKEKRVVLIIGNGKYKAVHPLENPSRDAELLGKTFRSAGFNDVSVLFDLTREQMMLALQEFKKSAADADWAAVYFAGHGIEVSGTNYLIPIDGQLAKVSDVSTQTVNLEYLLDSVEVAKKLRLVILDACRNNPFVPKITFASASREIDRLVASPIGRGLGRIEPAPGTLVVYSAKHGEYALDGDGKNSPFAEALVKRIEQKPAIEVRRLFDFVREDVVEATRRQQQPFAYGSLSAKDDFFISR